MKKCGHLKEVEKGVWALGDVEVGPVDVVVVLHLPLLPTLHVLDSGGGGKTEQF